MQTRFGKITDLVAALLLLCAGGGVSGGGVWYHASGIIAGQAARLQIANDVIAAQTADAVKAIDRLDQADATIAAAADAVAAAKTRLDAADKREQALQVQLARAEAALAAKPTVVADRSRASSPAPVGRVDPAAMVAAHNRWRSEVGVPGLAWSDKLAKVAQDWADHLAADDKCSIYHSKTGYGENVYYAGAVSYPSGRRAMQPISATRPVQMWGAEKEGYDAATGQCSAVDGCGHYTQVVWNETTEVGCGMAVCGNKAQIWVCNYFPAGNVARKKPF